MNIIQVKGNVKFPITLDPSVWIFDDRKFTIESFLTESQDEQLDESELNINQERIIREGTISPPTLKTETKFKREQLLDGNFAINLGPFLKNTEPDETSTTCTFKTKNGLISVPLEKAYESVAFFSKEGKPLKDNGPIHIYFADRSNISAPITDIEEITIT